MLIGYARVSTQDQNLDLQRTALEKAGCERVYEDKISSGQKHRPGLERALEHVREGDTLVVWKLDRLGRSVKELIEIVGDMEKRGVNFRSLTDNVDASTATNRAFFHFIALMAQLEREMVQERTRAGLAAAQAQGRHGGPPTKLTPRRVARAKQLLAEGKTYKEVAVVMNVSASSLYRLIPAKNGSS